MHKKCWAVIDRPFYVVVACQPRFLNLRFLRQLLTMSHTNRFVRNQVIVSGARSGQGRRVLCAAKRTLDGEDDRPSIRVRSETVRSLLHIASFNR